jgi:hypothetical protein
MDSDTFWAILFLLLGSFLLITHKKVAQVAREFSEGFFGAMPRSSEKMYDIGFFLVGIFWIILSSLVLLGII